MKTLKFILTILISVIHVHISAYTVENIPNPLFWITFISSGIHYLDERWMYFVGGIVIQSIITIIIAYVLIGYRKIAYWSVALLFIVGLTCLIHLNPIFPVSDFTERSLTDLYNSYYSFWGQPTLPAVIVFSVYQLLLLLLYKPICQLCKKLGIDGRLDYLYNRIHMSTISRKNLKRIIFFFLVYCGTNLILIMVLYHNTKEFNELFSVLAWQICFFFAPINSIFVLMLRKFRLYSVLLESISLEALYSVIPLAMSYALERIFNFEDIGSCYLNFIVFVIMNALILAIEFKK